MCVSIQYLLSSVLYIVLSFSSWAIRNGMTDEYDSCYDPCTQSPPPPPPCKGLEDFETVGLELSAA